MKFPMEKQRNILFDHIISNLFMKVRLIRDKRHTIQRQRINNDQFFKQHLPVSRVKRENQAKGDFLALQNISSEIIF